MQSKTLGKWERQEKHSAQTVRCQKTLLPGTGCWHSERKKNTVLFTGIHKHLLLQFLQGQMHLIFSRVSPSNWGRKQPLLLPEGSGCDCCNPANKQGRSHTVLSIWGLEMSHSKKIPKGIHPRSFFCFCNFQTLFQAIYWSMKDTASCCGIGGHSSNRPPFTARAMVGVWLDFPLSYCYFIFFTFFYSWYLLTHLKFLLKDMESKGTLYYLRRKGTYGTSNILAYAKMTP